MASYTTFDGQPGLLCRDGVLTAVFISQPGAGRDAAADAKEAAYKLTSFDANDVGKRFDELLAAMKTARDDYNWTLNSLGFGWYKAPYHIIGKKMEAAIARAEGMQLRETGHGPLEQPAPCFGDWKCPS